MMFKKHWVEVPVTYNVLTSVVLAGCEEPVLRVDSTDEYATIRFRASRKGVDKIQRFIRAYETSLIAPGDKHCFSSMSFHGASEASAGEFVRYFLAEASSLRIQAVITE